LHGRAATPPAKQLSRCIHRCPLLQWPHLTPPTSRPQLEGDGLRTVKLSVDDLKARFKHATVVATIQCAGNRRSEMKAMASPSGSGHTIKGLDWAAGAIGTAEWGGVRLRDVLLEAGGWPRGWAGALLRAGDGPGGEVEWIGVAGDYHPAAAAWGFMHLGFCGAP
jgi:hypothetical protein